MRPLIESHAVDDDILRIAQFLTTFQDRYRLETDPPPFFVTMTMLAEARGFQKNLEQTALLEQEVALFERRNGITSEEVKNSHEKAKRLQECRQKFQHATQNRRHLALLELLERVQVWTTKALAQEYFVDSDVPQEDNPDNVLCWSALLNLPSAEYSNTGVEPPPPSRGLGKIPENGFSRAFGRAFAAVPKDKGFAMAITPNIHTWSEFARYVDMISLLPSHRQAALAKSPLAKLASKNLRETTHVKYQFSVVDLVVLWIRAQRNSVSFRHLLQLFRVVRKPDGGREYSATFLGNHPNSTRRVWSETPVLDKLVAALVTNQMLCVHQTHVNKILSKELPPDVKRCRQISMGSSAKRQKLNPEDRLKPEEENELIRLCKVYLLRDWARRHKSVLEIIFHGDMESQRIYNRSAMEEYTVQLMGKGFKAEEVPALRFLSEIDSSLLGECTNGDNDVEKAVGLTLKTYREWLEQKGLGTNSLEMAALEWKRVNTMFQNQLKEHGVVRFSKSLFRTSADQALNPRELKGIMIRCAAPWPSKCSVCDENVSTSEHRFCACCDRIFHSKCCSSPSESFDTSDFLEENEPLKRLFQLSIPDKVPDYRDTKAATVQWDTKVITVVRKPKKPGGGLGPFGMHVLYSRACELELDQVLNGKMQPSELSRLQSPLATEHVGFVVSKVSENGFCHISGLLAGDFIVGIELVCFSEDKDQKIRARAPYTLKSTSEFDAKSLLRTTASVVKFIVKRPSIDIVQQSSAFVRDLQRLNSNASLALKRCQSMWYCSDCVIENTPKTAPQSDMALEAKHCAAVARYLSASDFGEPFRFEDLDASTSLEPVCCLQRLALMMDYIESANSACLKDDLYHSFYARSERLPWAPTALETKPLELLCAGIGVLAGTTANPSAYSRLLEEFCRKVCAWCLAVRVTTRRKIRTKGPVGLVAPLPCALALISTCQMCRVRLVEQPAEPCRECRRLQSSSVEPDFHEEIMQVEKWSSLVGSTILLLPGDPLLVRVYESLRRLNVVVDKNERPFELLIAAFSPTSFVNSHVEGGEQDTFRLLPIANVEQVKFLLSQCRSTAVSTDGTEYSGKLLSLEGVIVMTSREVEERIVQTSRVKSAVCAEIQRQAKCTCSTKCNFGDTQFDDNSNSDYFPCRLCGLDTNNAEGLEWKSDATLKSTTRLLESYARKGLHSYSDSSTTFEDAAEVVHLSQQAVTGVAKESRGNIVTGVAEDRRGDIVTGVVEESRDNIKGVDRVEVVDGKEGQASHQILTKGPVVGPRATKQLIESRVLVEKVDFRQYAPVAVQGSLPQGKFTIYQFSVMEHALSLKGSVQGRPVFSGRHLYQQVAQNHPFSVSEASMIIYAAQSKLIMVGLRLLLPRYSLLFAMQLLESFVKMDFSGVPILTKKAFAALLSHDYERLRREQRSHEKYGDKYMISLIEKSGMLYTYPFIGFGVDTVIARTLFQPNCSPEIERIRGGGPEPVSDSHETRTLATLEMALWHNCLVSGECETTQDKDSRGKARFYGNVFCDCQAETRKSREVAVDLFYISNVGLLGRTHRQSFRPDELRIPRPNSEAVALSSRFVEMQKSARPNVKCNAFISTETPTQWRDAGLILLLKQISSCQRLYLGDLSWGLRVYLFRCDPTTLFISFPEETDNPSSRTYHVIENREQICAIFRHACHELNDKHSKGANQNLSNGIREPPTLEALVKSFVETQFESTSSGSMRLVATLACLFDVSDTGSYRGDKHELSKHMGMGFFRNPRVHPQYLKPTNPCFHHGTVKCCTCSLSTERVVLQANKSFAGHGCVCMGHLRSADATAPTNLHNVSQLITAKRFLIDVAKRIPLALRSTAPLPRYLWLMDYFEVWRYSVESSQTLATLNNCFLILWWSIDAKRLPNWWASYESGWSTPICMKEQISTAHGLLLHLYVLDLAITEAIWVAANDAPEFSKAISDILVRQEPQNYDKRLQQTLKGCQKLGIGYPYKGEENSYCTVCQDGGDLVICELCPNVLHLECAGLSATPETFVCPECTTDVTTLQSSVSPT